MTVKAYSLSASLNVKCSAKIREEAAKFRNRYPISGVRNDQCSNTASVKINDQPYCKKHGGMVALNLLINDTIKGGD